MGKMLTNHPQFLEVMLPNLILVACFGWITKQSEVVAGPCHNYT
jgi:hypothetical protein